MDQVKKILKNGYFLIITVANNNYSNNVFNNTILSNAMEHLEEVLKVLPKLF